MNKKMPVKIKCIFVVSSFQIPFKWWKQCSLSDNPNAQTWCLRRAFLQNHRKHFRWQVARLLSAKKVLK